ncbi:MAG: DNA replication/repair protein RecF [Verrucomicrobiales bacterium]
MEARNPHSEIQDPKSAAHLAALRVRDFRCFDQFSCELSPGCTVFVGDNAQGKTSLLEAVCVLLRLQSPRATSFEDLVRFGQTGFGVSGDIGSHRLQFTYRGGKRELARDGASIPKAADYLAGSGLLVWMGNDDLQLVRGSGDARRRYLDFLGTQAHADYRPALLNYEKALRSRNRLLKADPADRRQIEAYTSLLVEHGEVLTLLRGDLVRAISPWAAEAHRQVSERDETLTFCFEPGSGADFTASLAAAREEERRRRVTVVGPHRDDIAILLDGSAASRFASEGQQRTIALALKLAQARLLENLRSTPPLLLIDDIFGELDPTRRNALLRVLPSGTQQLITATHLDWLDRGFIPQRIYAVRDGALVSQT